MLDAGCLMLGAGCSVLHSVLYYMFISNQFQEMIFKLVRYTHVDWFAVCLQIVQNQLC